MSERERFEDLPILGDLRDVLSARMREADAVAPSPQRRRGWAIAGLRRAPLALAVAVALAVVAVGLLALHHRSPAGGHGSPPATPAPTPTPAPPPSPMAGYVNRAEKETIARDHACASATNRGQTIDHGAPPQAMLSELGVLRRPPLAADPTNKVLYSIGWDKGAGVYVNYIRRARTIYGRSYWLVPEARVTPFAPIPDRCYREQRAALARDLRHVSPRVRRQALQALVDDQTARRTQAGHRAGLCFIEIGLHVRPHPGAVGFGCAGAPTPADPMQGGSLTATPGGGAISSGVVPDGVVRVTERFAASADAPARTLSSGVVNNVYVIRIPPHTSPFMAQAHLQMSDGRVVTISSGPSQVKAVGGGVGGGG